MKCLVQGCETFSKIAGRLFRWLGQISVVEILLLGSYLVMEVDIRC